ncbi:major facilitator superfamily domain-containing protein [Podospora fimiseda]|uniref:Major facilitator superfamily domain-containing protein n=1 Tax=Podospora fimiseda TaxID=252190 RepID=A0AAN7BXF6_9PEZI|nr:major facilitator superfamily domain-containing protein [Podospora fimiseda]
MFSSLLRSVRQTAEYQPLAPDATSDTMGNTQFESNNDELADQAEESGDDRVVLTEEDNKRIRHKTDRVILTLLVWVYFLQILDKTVLGFAAIFGLREDTKLTGNQYSLVGAIAPIAQLAWQPFSSILIVKVPHRILMPILVFGWGVSQICMPACHNFTELMVDRFFLGLFEAGCLPLFSIITGQWYRRSEQPVRVAAWYGTNGLATIFAALLAYGIGNIKGSLLGPWQWIFLLTGTMTIITVPFIYWRLDNDVESARFLTPKERAQAHERLRANQTGAGSRNLRWSQVLEAFIDIKTYLFIGIALANNLGAQVTNTFGPLILSGFGFDRYKTTLLNIPFGVIQYIVILGTAWAAVKIRWKSVTLLFMLIPILTGLIMLYILPRNKSHTPALLVGYYFLAFIFGCNTLIVSWILANTGGQTKRATMMSLYNAASSIGNIVGPLLFNQVDAPAYLPGLRSTMGVFAAMVAIVILQTGNLFLLNKIQMRRRVQNGKPAHIYDHSMESEYVDLRADNVGGIGDRAFEDLTDRENDEFVYVY